MSRFLNVWRNAVMVMLWRSRLSLIGTFTIWLEVKQELWTFTRFVSDSRSVVIEGRMKAFQHVKTGPRGQLVSGSPHNPSAWLAGKHSASVWQRERFGTFWRCGWENCGLWSHVTCCGRKTRGRGRLGEGQATLSPDVNICWSLPAFSRRLRSDQRLQMWSGPLRNSFSLSDVLSSADCWGCFPVLAGVSGFSWTIYSVSVGLKDILGFNSSFSASLYVYFQYRSDAVH